MIHVQTTSDKAAISLSLLCTIHCLVLPIVVVLVPSVGALPLADEAFHLWMLIAVMPISAFALMMGCRKHKRYHLLLIGGLGLFTLGMAAFWAHDSLGETWEKTLTVAGALIIVLGHVWNYRLCQDQDSCGCADVGESDLCQMDSREAVFPSKP